MVLTELLARVAGEVEGEVEELFFGLDLQIQK